MTNQNDMGRIEFDDPNFRPFPRPEKPTLWLGDLYKQGYLAGQIAMRERAAKLLHETDAIDDRIVYLTNEIRALEPEEPK